MFQQTIQDLFAIADAAGNSESLLAAVQARIIAFERFECGELWAQSEKGLTRFGFAPGRGEFGRGAIEALGSEPTLRVDTAVDLEARGLAKDSGLASLLVLRLEVRGSTAAVIVLGHSRAWSFAAAPLSRIRTIGSMALRLLGSASPPPRAREGDGDGNAEVNRLRVQISSLSSEINSLLADRVKSRSGKRR